jgi:hypothetical protein
MGKTSLTFGYYITGDAVEHWPEVAGFMAQVMPKMHGEMELEDFILGFLEERFHLFVGYKDDVPVCGMVTENVKYYRMKGFRVVAAAGLGFQDFMKQFMDYILGWAKYNGASFIEAWTDPAMTRYHRRFKAQKVYDIIRFPVEGE